MFHHNLGICELLNFEVLKCKIEGKYNGFQRFCGEVKSKLCFEECSLLLLPVLSANMLNYYKKRFEKSLKNARVGGI